MMGSFKSVSAENIALASLSASDFTFRSDSPK